MSAEAENLISIKDFKPGTRIYKYVFSQEQNKALYAVGVFWDKKLGLKQECKSQYQVKPNGFAILAPINFPEDKEHPTEGVWRHRFQFERCGETKIYNAIFVAKNGTKPEVKPYIPGETNASPQLISDSMKAAVAAAALKVKEKNLFDCKDWVITDMKITQQPHDIVDSASNKKISGAWQESWFFLACGQSVNVFLDFWSDGKGGAFYSTKSN